MRGAVSLLGVDGGVGSVTTTSSSVASKPVIVSHTLGPAPARSTSRWNAMNQQILSVTVLPSDLNVTLGGMVASRSVKYLGKLHTNVRGS
jgi:hypothetical protein